jgi:putative oxidoreductase
MSIPAGVIVLVGRVLFAAFFGPVAGVGHVRRSPTFEGYAKSAGFPIPAITGWPAGLWLLAGSASIALGVWPDLGSLMIGAFVVPAAFYFHTFWKIEDQSQRQTQKSFFWRNVVMLAASLMMFGLFVALGPKLRFTVTGPAVPVLSPT